MIKLLKSEFQQIEKRIIPLDCCRCNIGAYSTENSRFLQNGFENVKLDDVLFEMVPLIGVLYAVFCIVYWQGIQR